MKGGEDGWKIEGLVAEQDGDLYFLKKTSVETNFEIF